MSTDNFSQNRYLVVDDETFILHLTKRILSNLGCKHVITADSGEQALQFIDECENFDFILCDLNMPKMDGVEFIRLAAQHNFHGAVIFLSGEDERMLETALSFGKACGLNVLGSLQKPLSAKELKQLIGQYRGEQTPLPSTGLQPTLIDEQELSTHMEQCLEVFFQPKVRVTDGQICGVESLARWRQLDGTLLTPNTFISVAEQHHQIDRMTSLLFEKTLQHVANWEKHNIHLSTAVNFNINTFSHVGLIDELVDITQRHAISPEALILEVTETQLVEDLTTCQEIMMRMRLKHYRLSIDDFGTGHSSMSQLKSIPFTELKVDRSFVHNAWQNKSARAILASSISLAKAMNMEIVVEGVENRQDWDLVTQLGADYVQGFYCAKPMSYDELVPFVTNWQGPHHRCLSH